jgi:hypothetical protein
VVNQSRGLVSKREKNKKISPGEGDTAAEGPGEGHNSTPGVHL